jgi:hypothetical protein
MFESGKSNRELSKAEYDKAESSLKQKMVAMNISDKLSPMYMQEAEKFMKAGGNWQKYIDSGGSISPEDPRAKLVDWRIGGQYSYNKEVVNLQR